MSKESNAEAAAGPPLKIFAVKNIDREKGDRPIFRLVTVHTRDSLGELRVDFLNDEQSIGAQIRGMASVEGEYVDAHSVFPTTRKKGARKILKAGTGRATRVLVVRGLSEGDVEQKYKKLCGIRGQDSLPSGRERFVIHELDEDGERITEAEEILGTV